MKDFTPQQVIVIQALAAGSNVTAAAALAGVSRPTIYSWINSDTEFQKALAYAQQEWALTIRDRMQALSAKALDTLEEIIANPKASPSVRLKAALAILNRPQFPKPDWNLPAPTVSEAQQVIENINAQIEADLQATREEATYNHNLTELYTQTQKQAPSVACPCASGLEFFNCCGRNAPGSPHRRAA